MFEAQAITSDVQYRIEQLVPEQDNELVAFLDALGQSAAGAMVLGYHYPENRDMLTRVLGPGTQSCSFAARSATTGEVLAVLPGMLKQVGGHACYNSLPFFGPNAGVLADAADLQAYAQLASALTYAALDFARRQGAITAVFYSAFNPAGLSLSNPAFDTFPAITRIPKTTLFLRLPDATDPVWPSKIPWDITKAVNRGVTVGDQATPKELKEIYQIYARNCEERGIPLKPLEAIEYLTQASQDRVKTYFASLDGQIIAGLLVLWGPQTVSYYLPCVDSRHRSLQPITLLIDRACRDASRHGRRYWNWESSPGRDSGVYQFKKKWGSTEASYEIVVVLLSDEGSLRQLGARELAAQFPFFFVYPYDAL